MLPANSALEGKKNDYINFYLQHYRKKMDLHVHSDIDMCVAAALQTEGACCWKGIPQSVMQAKTFTWAGKEKKWEFHCFSLDPANNEGSFLCTEMIYSCLLSYPVTFCCKQETALTLWYNDVLLSLKTETQKGFGFEFCLLGFFLKTKQSLIILSLYVELVCCKQ